ncbi:MAG: hypothetical protein AB7P52_02400 [Alphaproteobacteria bacterium]
MTEKPLTQIDSDLAEEAGLETTATIIAAEARAVSGLAVDRRARLALELAAFAVEHGGTTSGHDALALGRQLRAVADTCTEAATLSHGLVDRLKA